jgi:RNA polymerase sigma-70 factor (ECF subfamily)
MTFRDVAITEATTSALAGAEAEVTFRMDEDAFRGFYDRTSRMLWVYLQRMTGDGHAADDLLQDCYYRFLRADVQLESEAHRRHYLFRIATNLARDRFRRKQVEPPLVPHDDAVTGAVVTGAGSDGSVERRLDLTHALSRLANRERAMLWLAYVHGASHQEIAAVVGVKTGSVKPLLYRARQRLRGLLGRKPGSEDVRP